MKNVIATPLVAVVTVIAAILGGFFIGRVEHPSRNLENQLSLYPNIETMGLAFSGANLTTTAQLMYRQSGESAWHAAHPLVRIDDGRLIGSLFGLSPATTYEVKVLDGLTEIRGSAATQSEELPFAPLVILHVNDDAPTGGDGSAAAPFRTNRSA